MITPSSFRAAARANSKILQGGITVSDILSLLKENMSGFSKGQKRIAQYILESYDKAAFMTANKLAQMVGVSESTVVRFAVDLGFDGFPSMQKTMQEMVLNRLTSVQRIEVANDRMKDQDVISTVFHSDMEKLRQTEETVSREEFGDAVAAILKAKRVYIIGVRSVELYVQQCTCDLRCQRGGDV